MHFISRGLLSALGGLVLAGCSVHIHSGDYQTNEHDYNQHMWGYGYPVGTVYADSDGRLYISFDTPYSGKRTKAAGELEMMRDNPPELPGTGSKLPGADARKYHKEKIIWKTHPGMATHPGTTIQFKGSPAPKRQTEPLMPESWIR